jgi:tRNA A-37 threonylcarbamoyl transferase component Bud32
MDDDVDGSGGGEADASARGSWTLAEEAAAHASLRELIAREGLRLDITPGRLSAAYEVQRPVGRGKFATVYKATRRSDGATVALKQIAIFDFMDERAREKTLKELRLAQTLEHPNIISFLDGFVEGRQLVLVFEYAEAGDLKRQVRKARERGLNFEERVVWRYFSQIADAVAHMHSRRILHRDLKPANVFLTLAGVVKVGDLGLGRLMSEHSLVAHSKVGTPLYMAPETLKGAGHDYAADIWSLGCILYELAVGTSPFKEEGITLFALFQKITAGAFPPISDALSPQLRALVDRMLQQDPAARPGITEVARAAAEMRAATAREHAARTAAGGGGEAAPTPTPTPAAPAPAPPPRPAPPPPHAATLAFRAPPAEDAVAFAAALPLPAARDAVALLRALGFFEAAPPAGAPPALASAHAATRRAASEVGALGGGGGFAGGAEGAVLEGVGARAPLARLAGALWWVAEVSAGGGAPPAGAAPLAAALRDAAAASSDEREAALPAAGRLLPVLCRHAPPACAGALRAALEATGPLGLATGCGAGAVAALLLLAGAAAEALPLRLHRAAGGAMEEPRGAEEEEEEKEEEEEEEEEERAGEEEEGGGSGAGGEERGRRQGRLPVLPAPSASPQEALEWAEEVARAAQQPRRGGGGGGGGWRDRVQLLQLASRQLQPWRCGSGGGGGAGGAPGALHGALLALVEELGEGLSAARVGEAALRGDRGDGAAAGGGARAWADAAAATAPLAAALSAERAHLARRRDAVASARGRVQDAAAELAAVGEAAEAAEEAGAAVRGELAGDGRLAALRAALVALRAANRADDVRLGMLRAQQSRATLAREEARRRGRDS